ncbi:MAG: LytTR family DNA-binding domain-containing protein [Bacteroidota bacterium]
MLRAIIIDDEEAGIETLKILALRNNHLIRVVAATLKAEEGIVLIEDYKPDVVFLDISMPAMSGFELIKKLTFKDFKLIFTTAHKEYALQAIKQRAFDYLLKPISDTDFKQCIENMIGEQKKADTTGRHDPHLFIEIRVKDGVMYLKQKEIIRLEASRSYTEFYMDNGTKHIASKSMKDFEQKLDPHLFFRCHKSHIVNLEKVQKFINHDGFYALMSNGSMPDVSKAVKDDFLQQLRSV